MSVIERPHDYEVNAPESDHRVLTPFYAFEEQPLSKTEAALIVLNNTLEGTDVESLWKHSTVRVCADGGANRLYDYLGEKRNLYIPMYIVGDLDSLRPDVKEYYVSQGCYVIPQYSGYATDFMKSIYAILLQNTPQESQIISDTLDTTNGLQELVHECRESPTFKGFQHRVVNVVGGIGGRFDQTFHLINQLYSVAKEFPELQVTFFSPYDVIFLIQEGTSYIKYSSRAIFNSRDKVPKCGLLPFAGPVTLHSEGLEYDVKDWKSEVGGAVSTSNGVVGVRGLTITTTGPIVMSIESYRS